MADQRALHAPIGIRIKQEHDNNENNDSRPNHNTPCSNCVDAGLENQCSGERPCNQCRGRLTRNGRPLPCTAAGNARRRGVIGGVIRPEDVQPNGRGRGRSHRGSRGSAFGNNTRGPASDAGSQVASSTLHRGLPDQLFQQSQQHQQGSGQQQRGVQLQQRHFPEHSQDSNRQQHVFQQPRREWELGQIVNNLESENESLKSQIAALQHDLQTLQQRAEESSQRESGFQRERDTFQREKEALQHEKDATQREKEINQREKELNQRESNIQHEKVLQREKEVTQRESDFQRERDAFYREKEALQRQIDAVKGGSLKRSRSDESLADIPTAKRTLRDESGASSSPNATFGNATHNPPAPSATASVESVAHTIIAAPNGVSSTHGLIQEHYTLPVIGNSTSNSSAASNDDTHIYHSAPHPDDTSHENDGSAPDSMQHVSETS